MNMGHAGGRLIGRFSGWLAVCGAAALLAACGGGGNDDSGNAQVRVINATVGVPSIDLFVGDTQFITAVAANTASAYKGTGSGSVTIKATSTGSATAIGTAAPAFDKDGSYTVVAWGLAGANQVFYFPDTEAAPATGMAKVRLFNTALDAGSLDLYLTTPTADLNTATPIATAIAGSRFSGYSEVSAGTYRLRATANGSKTDVRLDLAAVTLAAQDVMTFIAQPTQSGILVHGLQVLQKGAVTAKANTQARARLVASVAGNGAITGSVGATSLNVGLPSPSVGNYVLVPAGTQTLSAKIGGSALPPITQDKPLTAGADYTLLVYGTQAAPQLNLITDDNRLPAGTNAKLRLVNGLSNQGGVTMAMDFSVVANNVTPGTASDFAQMASTASSRIDVTSGLTGATLYTTGASPVAISQQSVYTLFLLDGATNPSGALRKER